MNASAYRLPARAKVLCVDDDLVIGELVSDVLRTQLRLEVDVATTGSEALEAIGKADYDLVIVDFLMPGMTGGELYRQIEREHPQMLPRLLFITGDVLSESTLRCIASTGRPSLFKPFGLPELTGAVRRVLIESFSNRGSLPAASRAHTTVGLAG